MNMKTKKTVGMVLIVAGLTILIAGIVQFSQFQGSLAGKVSGVVSDITGSRSEKEIPYIIMMISGAIAALMGIIVTVKK